MLTPFACDAQNNIAASQVRILHGAMKEYLRILRSTNVHLCHFMLENGLLQKVSSQICAGRKLLFSPEVRSPHRVDIDSREKRFCPARLNSKLRGRIQDATKKNPTFFGHKLVSEGSVVSPLVQ